MMVGPIDVDLQSFEAAQDPLHFVAGLVDVTAFANESLMGGVVCLVFHHILVIELADGAEMGLRVYD